MCDVDCAGPGNGLLLGPPLERLLEEELICCRLDYVLNVGKRWRFLLFVFFTDRYQVFWPLYIYLYIYYYSYTIILRHVCNPWGVDQISLTFSNKIIAV